MNTTDRTDDPIDPIAILQDRDRRTAEDKARKEAEDAERAAAKAKEMKEKQPLVPELVERLLRELGELYELYVTSDYPQLERARLIDIVDHGDKTDVKPRVVRFKNRNWLQRLFRPSTAPNYMDMVRQVRTKQRPCWEATYINLSNPRPFVYVYLDVETGQIYCNSFAGGYLSMLKVDVLNERQLYELTYEELSTLLTNLEHNAQMARSSIRHREWEIEHAERTAELERRLAQVTEESTSTDSSN